MTLAVPGARALRSFASLLLFVAACGDRADRSALADAGPADAPAVEVDAADPTLADASSPPPDGASVADAAPPGPACEPRGDAGPEPSTPLGPGQFEVLIDGPGTVEVLRGAESELCSAARCVYDRPATGAVVLRPRTSPTRTFQGWTDCEAVNSRAECALGASVTRASALFAPLGTHLVQTTLRNGLDKNIDSRELPDGSVLVLQQHFAFSGQPDLELLRLAATDGAVLWSTTIPDHPLRAGLSLDSAGAVFVVAEPYFFSVPAFVLKVDVATGAILYRQEVGGRPVAVEAIAGDDAVVCRGGDASRCCRLRGEDGATLSCFELGGVSFADLALAPDGTLVVGTELRQPGNMGHAELRAFDVDGTSRWTQPLQSEASGPFNRVFTVAAGEDGTVAAYFTVHDVQYVGAFDLATGHERWRYPLVDEIAVWDLLVRGGEVIASLYFRREELSAGRDRVRATELSDVVLLGLDAASGVGRHVRRLGQGLPSFLSPAAGGALWVTGAGIGNPIVFGGEERPAIGSDLNDGGGEAYLMRVELTDCP